jgi:hypothetical protein
MQKKVVENNATKNVFAKVDGVQAWAGKSLLIKFAETIRSGRL